MERQGRVLLCMLFAACMLGCEDGGGSASGLTVSNRLDSTVSVSYEAGPFSRWSEDVKVKPGETIALRTPFPRDDYYHVKVSTGGISRRFEVSVDDPMLVITPEVMGGG